VSNTPEAAVQAWMNSPGHRRALLSRDAHSLGIGVSANIMSDTSTRYHLRWTQQFGYTTEGISEADLFASLGVPIDTTTPTTPQPPTNTPNTTTPTTPNQTPAPTPQPTPSASVGATNTIVFTEIANRGNTLQFTYTNANGNTIRAFISNNTVNYGANRTTVPFTVARDGNVLVITSGGTTHRLNVGDSITLQPAPSAPTTTPTPQPPANQTPAETTTAQSGTFVVSNDGTHMTIAINGVNGATGTSRSTLGGRGTTNGLAWSVSGTTITATINGRTYTINSGESVTISAN